MKNAAFLTQLLDSQKSKSRAGSFKSEFHLAAVAVLSHQNFFHRDSKRSSVGLRQRVRTMSFNGFTPVPLSYASSSKTKATHYLYVRPHESSKSSKKRKEKAAATPAAHPFAIGGGFGTCLLFVI